MQPLTLEIIQQLRSLGTEEKRRILSRFFKTGEGQYGEGDRFLGVVVPLTRQVVKQYREAPLPVVEELLESEWHECRLCALLILVEQYRRTKMPSRREELHTFYLAHTVRINNWDLVDMTAPCLVGEHLLTHSRTILDDLSRSPLLWEQRIAVVGTLGLIRHGEYLDTLRLAEYFAAPERRPLHDLMQKAVGWMLREVGKRDRSLLEQFLKVYAVTMPRTMLRYAIEKFSEEERRKWMGK
jgi:3-methyladenine DNA glycosylase AlkD